MKFAVLVVLVFVASVSAHSSEEHTKKAIHGDNHADLVEIVRQAVDHLSRFRRDVAESGKSEETPEASKEAPKDAEKHKEKSKGVPAAIIGEAFATIMRYRRDATDDVEQPGNEGSHSQPSSESPPHGHPDGEGHHEHKDKKGLLSYFF